MLRISSPISVTLEMTPGCKQRCFFCSQKLAGHTGKEYFDNQLDTEQILKVIDKLGSAGVMDILITGGEPLSREDLPRIIEKCMSYNIYPEVVTNAIHATKEMSHKLYEAGLEWVQVSMQGPEELHDEIVGLPRAFKMTMQGMRNIRNENIEIVLSSVVMKCNYERLPEMLDIVGREGLVNSYRTLRLMPYSKEALSEVAPPSGVERMNDEIMSIASKYGIDVSDLYSGLRKRGKIAAYSQTMCKAGKTEFAILSDGTVVPCMALKEKDFAVGNILHDDVSDLWNNEIMEQFRVMTPDDYTGNCGECEEKWSCYTCRAIAYNLTGDLYGSDITCLDILKTLTDAPNI